MSAIIALEKSCSKTPVATPEETPAETSFSINDLPEPLLSEIFRYLNLNDLLNFSLTCNKFNIAIFKGDYTDRLWKILANSIGLVKIKKTYLESYKKMKKALKKAISLIDQIVNPYSKALAQTELVKLYLKANEKGKAISLINPDSRSSL